MIRLVIALLNLAGLGREIENAGCLFWARMGSGVDGTSKRGGRPMTVFRFLFFFFF